MTCRTRGISSQASIRLCSYGPGVWIEQSRWLGSGQGRCLRRLEARGHPCPEASLLSGLQNLLPGDSGAPWWRLWARAAELAMQVSPRDLGFLTTWWLSPHPRAKGFGSPRHDRSHSSLPLELTLPLSFPLYPRANLGQPHAGQESAAPWHEYWEPQYWEAILKAGHVSGIGKRVNVSWGTCA